ncbi:MULTISPECIES: XTP/dITP diphosphatase [Oceanobacillus]|uniref:dITP/XTP pyrophosphatase n=1 Tax=Oceanobacillus kimchii TaxID=746691 RepID=A0ABQ5TKT9_9BACI|nr:MULTISPECIES: XTP/dITP diphosphatase [Oceanobacillus]MBT2600898.1 XTP/dITP diphosphatase [Oceanobacillus sp. ISL-74]MBT2650705.1 XTP/dITP diphosphatase [Oceanobacillus sp. ISL-73]MCT1575652.1 XTP/dITP diphosphatase [Oceanobacillus kimchii]MCT2137283.1 XTP/dITP diphosphatase [Oceanobacillus kimchii]OEH55464.1 non-canonical purine NTP pyrophosphatase [Oceanobacillus sp. E9]
MKKIIVATKNKGKAKEFKEFFASFDIQAISLLDLPESIPDIEETGTTFEENAALKAEQISERFNTAVIADDSGLIIDALNGRPGLFSARYAGEPTNDQANIDKVLQEMQDVPDQDRHARFICVLAIAQPGEETTFNTGYCEGYIHRNQKGDHGFGYDPIFIPKGYDVTMAELDPDKKNQISHRKNAIDQLEKWLHTL